MKPSFIGSTLLLSLVTACASNPPPDATTAETAQTTAVTAPPPKEAEAKPVTDPPKAAELTPEQKKKAEAQRELQEDRAKAEAAHKIEIARWTPELHAEAKALGEKTFPTGKAAIQAAMAGKHRPPANVERDKHRHPIETLEFFGFKPTMTVLEVGPGEGWYTELLAPALAQKGKLLVTNTDPNGPADERATFYGQRFKLFADKAPELYGKIETIVVDPKAPKIGHEGAVDVVLLFRGLHGLFNNGRLDVWLAEMHKSLKPKGVLGIEQHRANADAKPEESSKKGYLPEKWVIERIEAAGFKLAGKSEVNANPKDTKDYAEGVWALPPSYAMGDKDRDKYTAIGESDRMTLKFVKVAKPAAKPDEKAGAKPDEKPAAKPDEKPAAKPDAKPAAKPEAPKK